LRNRLELVLHSPINYAFRSLHEYLDGALTGAALREFGEAAGCLFFGQFGLHESPPSYLERRIGLDSGWGPSGGPDSDFPDRYRSLYQQEYFSQRLNGEGWQEEIT
jgi:hypothetical protein